MDTRIGRGHVRHGRHCASTIALASDSASDRDYTTIENALQRLGTERDALVAAIRTILTDTGHPDVTTAEVNDLNAQAQHLLTQARGLGYCSCSATPRRTTHARRPPSLNPHPDHRSVPCEAHSSTLVAWRRDRRLVSVTLATSARATIPPQHSAEQSLPDSFHWSPVGH